MGGIDLTPESCSKRTHGFIQHLYLFWTFLDCFHLELERCRQQAGFPVIKEKEESSPSASEADLDADEWPEPTQEEWRQVRVARCCSLRFGGIRTDQGFQKQEPVSSSSVGVGGLTR